MRQYSNNGYSIFDKHLFTINTTNYCNCLDVCTGIRFKHNVVYTHRNLTKNVKKPQKRLKYLINFVIFKHKFIFNFYINLIYLYRNLHKSIIVMYYKRNWWSIQRTALIPENELLGNIGGSLGLFLGASIISVFELVYFFVVRLYVDRWNEKKKKKDLI
uniref:Amiloride-sensitive cation channel 5 n=1 Tax=Schizaphis graminum TaxID=13262 RepID=A0A2S2P305_SCHGA